jgi:hypothetical protein
MTQDLRESIERARQFSHWAESKDGLFDVFRAVRSNYLEELVASDATDRDLRDACYHRIKALDDISRVMIAVIAEGKGAEAQIEALTRADSKREYKA